MRSAILQDLFAAFGEPAPTTNTRISDVHADSLNEVYKIPTSFMAREDANLSSSFPPLPAADHMIGSFFKQPHKKMGIEKHMKVRDTSFLLRCWYHFRGRDEGEECQDIRTRFHKATWVDVLPTARPDVCGEPIYILKGPSAADKHGSWLTGAPETLGHPSETWHKCCLPNEDEGSGQMMCEKVNLVKRTKLAEMYNGFCGQDRCMGHRDRCLEETFPLEYQETGDTYVKQCPHECSGKCEKVYLQRKCVYIGREPAEGYEGMSMPFNPHTNESEKYRVIDVGKDAPSEADVENALIK